jgi:hypothetical protein
MTLTRKEWEQGAREWANVKKQAEISYEQAEIYIKCIEERDGKE